MRLSFNFDSRTWKITLKSSNAQQFDNNTVSIVFTGNFSNEFNQYEALVAHGNNLDIIPLEFWNNSWRKILTAEHLAFDGFYVIQLRAKNGDKVKHSDTCRYSIGKSLSGDAHWPTLPTAFSEALEAAETAADNAEIAAGHYPYIDSENHHWYVWDVESQEYVDTGTSAKGTDDYEELGNKPKINGIELTGDKTTEDIGIEIPTKTSDLTNDSGFLTQEEVEEAVAVETERATGAENDIYEYISLETTRAVNAEIAIQSDLNTFKARTDNPHGVTKSQVGLGNVDNTSDANKPISTATQNALNQKANASDLASHVNNHSNPHAVTKAQVGLGNVDNTSDVNKPISTATQTALDEIDEELASQSTRIANLEALGLTVVNGEINITFETEGETA